MRTKTKNIPSRDDRKVVRSFCFFPRKMKMIQEVEGLYARTKKVVSTYYVWLENVYIEYQYREYRSKLHDDYREKWIKTGKVLNSTEYKSRDGSYV